MQTFRPPLVETRYIGENDRYPSHFLPPGLFVKVENGLIDNNILSKRPGNTQTAASLGSQNGSSPDFLVLPILTK